MSEESTIRPEQRTASSATARTLPTGPADAAARRNPAGGAPEPGGAPISSLTSIRLIASRELVTRLCTKAFRVMTAIVLLVIVAAVLAFHLLPGLGSHAQSVGVVGGQATVQQLKAAGGAVGQELTTTTVADEAAGRAEVAAGTLDALVVPSASGSLTVVVDKTLDPTLRGTLTVLARNLALADEISRLGGDPAAVRAAVSRAGVDVQALKPPRNFDPQQLVLGGAAGILIYMSLMIGGQLVAQGVVEEKSSRVVEILLATVRPWELMTGKVLGIGALGLIQIVLYGVVGVGLATALGTITLSISAAAGTVIWLIVWYFIGFIMYAFVFAGAGALVSRQEDAAGVIMPVTSFVIVGYVIGIAILPGDPTNTFAEVMSVIPLFAPTLMPMRLAMGGVPGWEAALALVLAIAMIPLLAALSGRVYRNAVIHIGARVSLRTALAR